MIKEYLKEKVLICDGAMGTYYSEITGNDISYCEFANLNDKNTIKSIHDEYIEAGAKLIRTNTFSANTYALEVTRNKLKEIIYAGIDIAKSCAFNNEIFIGGSIGPIREENLDESSDKILDEYKFIVDCFLEKDINIFIFETFSSTNYLKEISEYIKEKKGDSFILTQFAFKPDGFTREGVSAMRIAEEVKSIKSIDAYGFNCGCGPTHLYTIMKKIDLRDSIVSALPNAGFPERIHERTVFPNTPKYFAQKIKNIRDLGTSIIGGCCGTNPGFIREIVSIINVENKIDNIKKSQEFGYNNQSKKVENKFINKLENNEFVIAMELSAPMDCNIDKLMNAAKKCKENNIDLITIPDSPMSKVRADSAIIASKLKRDFDIDVMPHICCRDKNTNAIRSTLLGANIQDIRNVLAITGDPISDASKVEAKSVFNLNSFKLIELINNMNEEVFKNNEFAIGGALNLNVKNSNIEYNRMLKKMEKGAKFFLTQPIYDDNAIEFLKYIKQNTDVKILGGILPIVTYRNAQFLNNELPGVTIPDKYLNMFREDMDKQEAEEIGIKIAVEIGKKLKEVSDGLYFIIPFNRIDMILKIVKQIKEG